MELNLLYLGIKQERYPMNVGTTSLFIRKMLDAHQSDKKVEVLEAGVSLGLMIKQ